MMSRSLLRGILMLSFTMSLNAMKEALEKFKNTQWLYTESNLRNYLAQKVVYTNDMHSLKAFADNRLVQLADALEKLYPHVQPILDELNAKEVQIRDLQETKERLLANAAKHKELQEHLEQQIRDKHELALELDHQATRANADKSILQELLSGSHNSYDKMKSELNSDLEKMQEIVDALNSGIANLQSNLDKEMMKSRELEKQKNEISLGYQRILCFLSMIEDANLTEPQKAFITMLKKECDSNSKK